MTTAPNATARAERAALADLLAEVGPDAPTCCAGWRTRDLAAHLVVRERRPDAAAGLLLGPLAGWTGRVQDDAARRPWPELVALVRGGPPWYSPQALGALDAATNTIEFFVHHEDVRRARAGWTPRTLDAAASAQLWTWLVRGAGLLARRSPVGIVAVPSDGPRGTHRLRAGEPSVTLTGPVGECVLAVYGRPTAGLTLEGADADVAAFRAFSR